MTALESLDIRPPWAPCRPSFARTLALPGFWLGLCAARDIRDDSDHLRIAAYERAAKALTAEPERDPLTVPEIKDWLSRRAREPQ